MKPSAAVPKRILVRGVNWLGDAVMSTPALLRLREAHPRARITLFTPAKLAGLWPHHPALDAVIAFEPGESVWRVAQKLRREKFDLALVLPNSPRSALEVWLAGIPERVGYAAKWRRGLLTRIVPQRAGAVEMRKRSVAEIKRIIEFSNASEVARDAALAASAVHHLHQYLHLTAAVGANPTPVAPRLEVTAIEVAEAADGWLSGLRNKLDADAPGQPVVFLGLNPGAEYGPAKRWPAENFAAVTRAVSERVSNASWLIFGGPHDWKLCDEIAQAVPGRAINLAGKTSLRELMALLKGCEVLLTNDTGPMHVAAAVGTRVVALFGSTSPELTGPGLPGNARHSLLRADVACAPCFRRECPIDFRCMNGITVEQAAEAVLAQLSRPRS